MTDRRYTKEMCECGNWDCAGCAIDIDDAIFLAERYGEPIPGATDQPPGLVAQHGHGDEGDPGLTEEYNDD